MRQHDRSLLRKSSHPFGRILFIIRQGPRLLAEKISKQSLSWLWCSDSKLAQPKRAVSVTRHSNPAARLRRSFTALALSTTLLPSLLKLSYLQHSSTQISSPGPGPSFFPCKLRHTISSPTFVTIPSFSKLNGSLFHFLKQAKAHRSRHPLPISSR